MPATDIEALSLALEAWPDTERAAPQACFAEIEQSEATGPQEPGVTRFIALRANPTWPWPLARHANFAFDAGFGADALRTLAAWAPLAQIRSLALSAAHDAEAQAALPAVLAAPHAVGLRAVHLQLGGVSPAGLRAILAALPAGVEALSLSWAGLDGEAVGPLVDFLPGRPGLRALKLHHTRLRAEGFAALGQAGAFDHLASLTLHGAALDDRAAAAWAGRPSPGVLRSLGLQDDPFDGGFVMEYGLGSLADAGWLSGLEELRLGYHPLRGEVLVHVLATADWSRLRALRLWASPFGEADARALLGARGRLPELRVVEAGDGEVRTRLLGAVGVG